MYTILFFSNPETYLSSCFLTTTDNSVQVWTDCALNISPNPDQLALIAKNASEFYFQYTNQDPIVAFLSYASFDSAGGLPVENIKKAAECFKKLTENKIKSFAPIQFDTCVNKTVFEKKAKISSEAMSNILVFPDLNSANISYKVANQLAKQEFYGPFVIGTEKLVCDLSRSVTESEIIKTLEIMYQILKNKK